LGRPVLVGRAGAAGGAVLTGGTAVGELRLHLGEAQTRLAVGDPAREQRGHQHRERGGLLLLTGVLGRRGRGGVAPRILVLRGRGIGLVRVLVRVLTGRRGRNVSILARFRAITLTGAVPVRVVGIGAAAGAGILAGAVVTG